jgi:hypothetical protein
MAYWLAAMGIVKVSATCIGSLMLAVSWIRQREHSKNNYLVWRGQNTERVEYGADSSMLYVAVSLFIPTAACTHSIRGYDWTL